MGAFNEWAAGSALEAIEGRRVAAVALNLMAGAAVSLRASNLSLQGIPVPAALLNPKPLSMTELENTLA